MGHFRWVCEIARAYQSISQNCKQCHYIIWINERVENPVLFLYSACVIGIPYSWIMPLPNMLVSITPELIINQQPFISYIILYLHKYPHILGGKFLLMTFVIYHHQPTRVFNRLQLLLLQTTHRLWRSISLKGMSWNATMGMRQLGAMVNTEMGKKHRDLYVIVYIVYGS